MLNSDHCLFLSMFILRFTFLHLRGPNISISSKFEQMCLSKRRFVILYYIIVNSIHSKKLTSLAIIPNFLLQLFFKPGLPLFQCFGQSEKQNKSSHCVFLKAACIRFLRAFLTALFWAFLSIFSLFLFTLSSTVFRGFFNSCSTDFGFFCRSVLSNFSCSFSSFSSMSSFNLKYSQFNKDVYLLLCSFFVFWSFLLKWLFLFVGNHPFAHDMCVLFCFTLIFWTLSAVKIRSIVLPELKMFVVVLHSWSSYKAFFILKTRNWYEKDPTTTKNSVARTSYFG